MRKARITIQMRIALACLAIHFAVVAVSMLWLPPAAAQPAQSADDGTVGKSADVSLVADKLDVSGDELYAIYRKGLITRHITSNGRFLPEIALESVDDFNEETDYDGNFIHVHRKVECSEPADPSCTIEVDGAKYKRVLVRSVPVDNVRYSEELLVASADPIANTPPHESGAIMWVPVVAPVKDPGRSNDGYFVVSSKDDNPLYYGGFALATFSLEAIHGVSQYSICYARKLARYFLASEMTDRNGYMLRLPAFFSSNRNRQGEPIIQGASAEELLGVFLGIMYYLRAEAHPHQAACPDPPLIVQMRNLRDRILGRVLDPIWFDCAYPLLGGFHEHPFMASRFDPSYQVGHFRFAFLASAGVDLTCPFYVGDVEVAEKNCQYCANAPFLRMADASVGDSATFAEYFTDLPFDFYLMFLTSTILILDSEIPTSSKELYADRFMEEYLRAALTSGPDVATLRYNAFLGVVAKLVYKYLSGNPQRDTEHRGSIWGDDEDKWRALNAWVEQLIWNAKSLHNKDWSFTNSGNNFQWQHNLPLVTPVDNPPMAWKNHNPHSRMGSFFAFKFGYYPDRSGSRFSKRKSWLGQFPGWKYGAEYSDFESYGAKAYTRDSYLDDVIVGRHGHHDNQVEAAGLGLLFSRMLLTHITHQNPPNSQRYPKPDLSGYDRFFRVLPWPGAEPMDPQSLNYVHRAGSVKLGGDRDQALSIVSIGEDIGVSDTFVLAYATEDDHLVLQPGFVADSSASLSEGVYLEPARREGELEFDAIELLSTTDGVGNQYLVAAERAEEGLEHWLRLSLWRVTEYRESVGVPIPRVATWQSPTSYWDAVEDIDVEILDRKWIAVLVRNRHEKHVIRFFRIDFGTPSITKVSNVLVSEHPYHRRTGHRIGLATAYRDVLIYSEESSDGWRLATGRWTGSELVTLSETTSHSNETLLGITTVKKLDFTQPDHASGYYLVAVTRKWSSGYLQIHSWSVTPSGNFAFEQVFDTSTADQFLVGREAHWERASITPVYWKNRPGFLIAGKGVARDVWHEDDYRYKSAKGIKLVYGYIMCDGRLTIESSSVIGNPRKEIVSDREIPGGLTIRYREPGRMVDVAPVMTDAGRMGAVSVHSDVDKRLRVVYWRFHDKFRQQRWQKSTSCPPPIFVPGVQYLLDSLPAKAPPMDHTMQ